MALVLNQLLSPRVFTGRDVRVKIGNLVTEYRRKKTEQGRTGASPCTWRYFDSIDKLLGEFKPFDSQKWISNVHLSSL